MSLFTVIKHGNTNLTSIKELNSLPDNLYKAFYERVCEEKNIGVSFDVIFREILLEWEE